MPSGGFPTNMGVGLLCCDLARRRGSCQGRAIHCAGSEETLLLLQSLVSLSAFPALAPLEASPPPRSLLFVHLHSLSCSLTWKSHIRETGAAPRGRWCGRSQQRAIRAHAPKPHRGVTLALEKGIAAWPRSHSYLKLRRSQQGQPSTSSRSTGYCIPGPESKSQSVVIAHRG